jgi:hypothetical protein
VGLKRYRIESERFLRFRRVRPEARKTERREAGKHNFWVAGGRFGPKCAEIDAFSFENDTKLSGFFMFLALPAPAEILQPLREFISRPSARPKIARAPLSPLLHSSLNMRF